MNYPIIQLLQLQQIRIQQLQLLLQIQMLIQIQQHNPQKQ